jgi:transcription initiation factor TFIIB
VAINDVYEQTFDEDVPAETHATGNCPECGGTVLTNSIETSCEDCGLVLEDRPLDYGPEWRSFEDEPEDRKRTGPPLTPTRHDRGLSTEIGFGPTDAHGTPLSSRKRQQLARLRREQKRGRWRSKGEQNLAHGLSEVRRVTSALELPRSVRGQACALYRTAAGENLIVGRSIEAVAAASVYAVCRCVGLPRTFDEVSEVAAVAPKRVSNAYGVLNRELELPTMPEMPADYVPRLASEHDLSASTRQRAVTLAREANNAGIGIGCNPTGFAAACVYQATRETDERVTQTSLAELSSVTPVTIRAQWNTLREFLEQGRERMSRIEP